MVGTLGGDGVTPSEDMFGTTVEERSTDVVIILGFVDAVGVCDACVTVKVSPSDTLVDESVSSLVLCVISDVTIVPESVVSTSDATDVNPDVEVITNAVDVTEDSTSPEPDPSAVEDELYGSLVSSLCVGDNVEIDRRRLSALIHRTLRPAFTFSHVRSIKSSRTPFTVRGPGSPSGNIPEHSAVSLKMYILVLCEM